MSTTDALPRAITACTRCRTRKTKCDRLFPKCSSCIKANVECSALDPATGRSIPRSYVAHLEERISALEQELATLKLSNSSISSPTRYESSHSTAASSPRSESTLTGEKSLSFAKMMFSAVRSPDASSLETPINVSSSPAGLPSFEEMQRLLHIYFNHSAPQVPILTPEEAGVYIQETYSPAVPPLGLEEKTSYYFSHILAAIAYAKDPADTRAEQQHASALYYLPFVFKQTRLSSLEAILLLTVYGTNRPSTPGIWYTLGIASRLITDLALHSSAATIKEQTLFWSWYVLDRQICVYLSRPVGIADNVIHCQVPPLEPIPTSFCQLRVMQSEIQRILHHSDTLPREYASLEAWRHVISQRLAKWFASIPKTNAEAGSSFNLDFLTLNYEQTRLLLHGFSSNLSITRHIVLESSKVIVDIYRDLWLQDQVNFIWLAIHNVHIAASSFIYALLHEANASSRTRMREMRNTVEKMLRGMSLRCPAALDILDTFLELSSDVEERLSQILSPTVPVRSQGSIPLDMESARHGVANTGMSDMEFFSFISNPARDAVWDNFIGGEDFTFMDFST